jgi:hypothetical protein
MTEAIIMACFMVRDLEETEVANEFVTSFAPVIYQRRSMTELIGVAPIFQASRNAKTMPMANI